MSGRHPTLLLCKVISTHMPKVAKCELRRLKLDKYVMKYYDKNRTVLARDEARISKVGDIVLLKQLPEKVSKRVSHQVDQVIYITGNVTDPITGLKCDRNGYWESMPGEWDAQIKERLEGQDIEDVQRTEGHNATSAGTAV